MLTYQQMDEAIKLVEQHMVDCQINQDFREANQVKQKLLMLKQIRDQVERDDIITNFNKRIAKIEQQARDLEEQVRKDHYIQMQELNDKKISKLDKLRQHRDNEISQSTYYKNRPSSEVQNLRKIMQYLSNQKEYKKAEFYQQQVLQADQEMQKKTKAEVKIQKYQHQQNIYSKYQQKQETVIKKFRDQEIALEHAYEKRQQEIQLKRNFLIQTITQERNLKIGFLDKTRTKTIKLRVQQQLDELEQSSYF
ncbi:hypothetical protein pb186bvf_019779 [Paramecium bursaria]